MIHKLKNFLNNLPSAIIYSIGLLIVWELILNFRSTHWTQLILLPAGAFIGYMILEIEILFPKKEILPILPVILFPLTFFILTSTPGMLGKGVIVFFNLRLIINHLRKKA